MGFAMFASKTFPVFLAFLWTSFAETELSSLNYRIRKTSYDEEFDEVHNDFNDGTPDDDSRDENPDRWALLVAGSKGWRNYDDQVSTSTSSHLSLQLSYKSNRLKMSNLLLKWIGYNGSGQVERTPNPQF